MRGIKILGIWMEEYEFNIGKIVEFLFVYFVVIKVYYLGLNIYLNYFIVKK